MTELWESDGPPNLEYDPQLEKFINEIIIYEAVEFSAFKFGVRSFDVQYLSALGHSMLGTYSELGPILCSVIQCSVFRCWVIRCSVIRLLK